MASQGPPLRTAGLNSACQQLRMCAERTGCGPFLQGCKTEASGTAATLGAVGGVRTACTSAGAGTWERSGVTQQDGPHAANSHLTCTCACLPRVRGEHRGRPEPGVPGERAEAHPGPAGQLLEPALVHGHSLAFLPIFTRLNVTFRQIKLVFFFLFLGWHSL